MPVKKSTIHPALLGLPEALRRTMEMRSHTQLDVSSLTKVPQPQISRVLSGTRKRLTPATTALCIYAGIEVTDVGGHQLSNRHLLRFVDELVGADPDVAAAVHSVLKGLAPFLRKGGVSS